MKKIKIVFLFFLLINLGCKKEIIEPQNSNPVFYFDGTIDALNLNIQAGVNNYYMYSTFYHDANNVYNFDSHLKKYECTSCTDDIQIIIKDYQTSATGDPINIGNSITTGFYPIGKTGGSPKSTDITLNAQASGPATSYFWDFGDGSTQTTAPGAILHTYNRHGKYQVCLTVTFSSGPNSTICSEVNVEIPDNAIDYNIGVVTPSGNDVTFTPNAQLGTGVIFEWDLGDGNTSTNSTAFTHTYSAPGIYLVTLTVTDVNGKKCVFSRNVKTLGFAGNLVNFFDVTASTSVSNPLALTNVIINYTDGNGVVYSTLNSNGSGYFKVNSIESYMNNENGLPTKKLNVEFECPISDGTTTKTIKSINSVIAIAYQ